jgi:SAM-dependent methyltransferase
MLAADAAFYASHEEYDDKWEFRIVSDRLRSQASRLRILDIGCGDGRFIESLQPMHEVRGVDFNEIAVGKARSKSLQAFALSLEGYCSRFPGVRHDVITLFHVLEHVAAPSLFIESLKSMLAEGGLLGISVPNPHRWTLSFARETWDYPPHHLTRWEGDSLCSFLERHGFRIVERAPERVRTYRQVRHGVSDIVWSLVMRHASLGIASSLDASDAATGGTRRAVKRSAARLLSRIKTVAINGVIAVIAAVVYPVFVLYRAEGRSLLVLARPV